MNLSYFEHFKGRALEVLNHEGAKSLMTLEFASIHPDFSPRKIGGLCLGEIVTMLGFNHAMSHAVDAITGLPRRLSGTHDKVAKAGHRKIEEGRLRSGLKVDVVLGFRGEIVPHEEPEVQSLIERLWKGRTDLSGTSSTLEQSDVFSQRRTS
jgi:hypothetical protein